MITPHDDSTGTAAACSTLAACYAPFKRGRTGRKGCSKYIQPETGSWVTLNPDGTCHLGAWHKHLGTLLDVAGEIEQRKEYADAWRINMLRAQRERDEAYDYLAALWKNGQLPAPMPETLRVNLSLHNIPSQRTSKT